MSSLRCRRVWLGAAAATHVHGAAGNRPWNLNSLLLPTVYTGSHISRFFWGKARLKIGFWFDANFVVIQCRRGACEGGFWWLDIGARVAQWIRRRSPKPKIGGSSPPVGTNVFHGLKTLGTNICWVSQQYFNSTLWYWYQRILVLSSCAWSGWPWFIVNWVLHGKLKYL